MATHKSDNGGEKKEKKEKRSVKGFVGLFSLGSKQGGDEVEDRAAAGQLAKRLEKLQEELAAFKIACPQLTTAIETHETSLAEATQQPDAGQRQAKYAQLIEASKKSVEQAQTWVREAQQHRESYQAVNDVLLERLGAALNNSARPSAGECAQALIIKLQNKAVDANTMPDASYLPYRIKELERLAAEAAAIDVSVDVVKQGRVKEGAAVIAQARDLLTTLPPELQARAEAALQKIDSDLDFAALGLAPDGSALSVRVGSDDVKMGSKELLRAAHDAAKDFRTVLQSKPGSDDRRLLELEGPEKFVDGLSKLQRHLKAFGTAGAKGLTPAQALAIHRYTGNDYSGMNQVSRGTSKHNDERLNLMCKLVEEALPHLPEYPAQAWPVYRAERAWNQDCIDKRYARGSEFTADGFWSTGGRGAFDQGGAEPLFEHIIYGGNGRDVASLSANPGEGAEGGSGRKNALASVGEVLFGPKTRFKVDSREVKPAAPKEGVKYDPEGNTKYTIRTWLYEQ